MLSASLGLAAAAAVGAGAVNALAGGGTLLLFPALLALGMPAVAANVHCTVALCPGYAGATLAQAGDLAGQRARLVLLLPAAACGGIAGAWLLLHTGEQGFRLAVPWLILLACLLLAAQEPLRARLLRAAADDPAAGAMPSLPSLLSVLLAAIYGGYFGAGVSVILLAVLGLSLRDTLTRLNALKQALALGANAGAALLFVLRAPVQWPLVATLALGALAGGYAGGRLAGRLPAPLLRRVVVGLGFGLALYYFVRRP